MGSTDHSRNEIQLHLRELLASPEFSRAGVQARALEAMVQATLDGAHPSGSDLAATVYGRSDHNYVRAIRQVVREIRLKLARLYGCLRDAPVRFEIPDGQYVIEVISRPLVATPLTTAPAAVPPATLEMGRVPSRYRPSLLGTAAMVALALLGIAAVIAWRTASLTQAASPFPAGARVDGQSLVVYDADRRPLPEWRDLVLDLARLPTAADPGVPWTLHLDVEVLSSSGDDRDTLVALSCTAVDSEPCQLSTIDMSSMKVVQALQLPLLGDEYSRPTVLHAPTDGEFSADFDISGCERAELDGDPSTDELVVSVQHRGLFPTEHVGVSLGRDRRWNVLFDYWTMGYASTAVLPDGDGDGADEILIYGARNADQVGFVTLLPPIPANRGLRGRTPNGRRPTLIDEVASYPVRGITLTFPNSPLASPALPEYYHLRGQVARVSLSPDRRTLIAVFNDGIRDPYANQQAQIIANLGLDGSGPAIRFHNYDFYLRSLIEVISAGRLEDRWRIRETESLVSLSQALAREVRSYDAESREPQWRPVDLEALGRRLGGR